MKRALPLVLLLACCGGSPSETETAVPCSGGEAVLDLGTTDPRTQDGVTAIAQTMDTAPNETDAPIQFNGTKAIVLCKEGTTVYFFVAPR